jgi:pentatricopeptide repeat protein
MPIGWKSIRGAANSIDTTVPHAHHFLLTMNQLRTMPLASMENEPPCRRRRRRRQSVPLFFFSMLAGRYDGHGVVTAFLMSPTSKVVLKPTHFFELPENRCLALLSTRSSDLPSKEQFGTSKTKSKSTGQPGKKETDHPPRIQKSVISLNNDIFGLRKQNNGAHLAEQRLQEAITAMKANSEQVLGWVDTKDKKRLKQYPDGVTFNSVLSAFARNSTRDPMAAPRAEQLLLQMEDLSDQYPHLRPTIFAYNAVLEAFAKNCNNFNLRTAQQSQLGVLRWFRKARRDPSLLPNTFSNNLVLTSNARSSLEWQSLEQWAMDYLDGKQLENVPDRNTYNQLLQSYAGAGEADKAENLLKKIVNSEVLQERPDKDIQANAVWFNLVLKALVTAETKNDTDGERAEKLLREMYELHKRGYGNIHPDVSTYNHVLNVYSGLGISDQVERLLEELEIIYLTKNVDGVELKPDRVTFTTAIKAYATSQRLVENCNSPQAAYDMAVNATKLFDRMNALTAAGWRDLTPNTVTCESDVSMFCVGAIWLRVP